MRVFSALSSFLVVGSISHRECKAFCCFPTDRICSVGATSFSSTPPPAVQRIQSKATTMSTKMSATQSNNSEYPSVSTTNDDTNNNSNDDMLIQQCIDRLKARGVKVVIFDMDLTIVNQHSRGQLPRGEPLDLFLSKVSPDFVKLAPQLYANGFLLAIATHSDEAEARGKIQPATHILGEELAKTVLAAHLPVEVADSFYIVAYNPYVHVSYLKMLFGGAWAKRHHMSLIQEHYQVKPNEMLMIDDTIPIVKDCIKHCGVQGVTVNPLVGFRMTDIVDKL